MKVLKEFREFALKGNVVDLAVGVIIGAAFGAVVKSLVDDIVMPLVGVALGGVDFSSRYLVLRGAVPDGTSLVDARALPGVSIFAYGQFVNVCITFVIVAFSVFMMIKAMNRVRRKSEAAPTPTTRPCPQCDTVISLKAKRCPNCTSTL